jgi:hypothetical protein
VRLRCALAVVVLLGAGCDPVPVLYVVDASTDAGAAEVGSSVDAGGSGEDSASSCGVRCPACPPNPGQCCPSGIPCLGDSCALDCDAGCSACNAGEVCCSKPMGQPVCRSLDSGKCPP